METYKKYDLIFFNEVVDRIVIKTVGGKNNPSIMFSPLSEYVYILGHYKAIDDVMTDINAALDGEDFIDGIEIGTETITLTPTITTIENADNTQSLPTSDLKAILLEYKDFLNTSPLDGTIMP